MSFYSQFLTPVDAVTVSGEIQVVGDVVDFGAVYSGFLAWASVDPSSADPAMVFLDTSVDNETWLHGTTGADVAVGQAQNIAVTPGRYVRVRAETTTGSSILTVQVALES